MPFFTVPENGKQPASAFNGNLISWFFCVWFRIRSYNVFWSQSVESCSPHLFYRRLGWYQYLEVSCECYGTPIRGRQYLDWGIPALFIKPKHRRLLMNIAFPHLQINSISLYQITHSRKVYHLTESRRIENRTDRNTMVLTLVIFHPHPSTTTSQQHTTIKYPTRHKKSPTNDNSNYLQSFSMHSKTLSFVLAAIITFLSITTSTELPFSESHRNDPWYRPLFVLLNYPTFAFRFLDEDGVPDAHNFYT